MTVDHRNSTFVILMLFAVLCGPVVVDAEDRIDITSVTPEFVELIARQTPVQRNIGGVIRTFDPRKLGLPENLQNWKEVNWSAWLAYEMGGSAEARMIDGSRVDILTDDVAWEVEWIDKWQEGIGQAIQYRVCTGRDPGLLILVRGNVNEVAKEYNRILAAVTDLRAHGYDFNLRFQKTD